MLQLADGEVSSDVPVDEQLKINTKLFDYLFNYFLFFCLDLQIHL